MNTSYTHTKRFTDCEPTRPSSGPSEKFLRPFYVSVRLSAHLARMPYGRIHVQKL